MEEYLELREDIYYNDIYSKGNGKGYYIIGCISQDSQLLVKENKIAQYKDILKKFNGENISNLIEKGCKNEKELQKLIKLFKEKGFLKGYENIIIFNEVNMVSLKILNIKLRSEKIWEQVICKILINLYKYFLLVVTILVLLMYEEQKQKNEFFQALNIFGFSNTIALGTKEYIYVFLLTPIMFIFHELAHRIAGIAMGLKEGTISFVMYLGFIPMIYVKQKGIYSLNRKDIITVICAGMAANLLIGISLLLLYNIWHFNILYYVAIANFRMIYINMLPISLTDGYFLLCILMKSPNIRMYMYKVLVNPKVILRLERKEKIMVVCMLISFLLITFFELFWALTFIPLKIRMVVIFIILITYTICLNKKGKIFLQKN